LQNIGLAMVSQEGKGSSQLTGRGVAAPPPRVIPVSLLTEHDGFITSMSARSTIGFGNPYRFNKKTNRSRRS